MGLITAVTSSVQGASAEVSGVDAISVPPLGLSDLSGIIVAVSLLYLLAALNITEAADPESPMRGILAGLAIPLTVAFAGIVLFHSLEAIGWFGEF